MSKRKPNSHTNADTSAAPSPRAARGERPGPGWFSRAELAELLDVSVQQVDRTYRPLIPADGVREVDGRPWFRARSLIDALVGRAERSGSAPEADDPLMTGDASPALERYREGRASMVELDLAEPRELVRFAVVREGLAAGIGAFRKSGELMTRRFGNDAGEMFNEAVEAFADAAKRAMEPFDQGSPARKAKKPR